MTWTVETLGTIVDAEIAALPKEMQASFLRWLNASRPWAWNGLASLTSSISKTSFGRCGLADVMGSPELSTSLRSAVGSSWCMLL